MDAGGPDKEDTSVSAWADNVRRNMAVQRVQLGQLGAGHHRVRLIYGDPGVVFQHLAVTFRGAPAAYPVAPETACARMR
jgi:hypothetical protein